MLKLKNKRINWYLFLVLAVFLSGLFLKTYRQTELLGFYYDQGRDALAALQILSGRPKLTGPISGIKGVLLGPFWFYLLAPFYLLSKNPGIAASLFALTDAVVVYFSYLIWKRISSPKLLKVSFLAWLIFYEFSWQIISYWRWFSNPTAIFVVESILIFFTLKLYLKEKINYFLFGLALGLSLQTELASAGFFPLIILIVFVMARRQVSFKESAEGFLGFFLTLVPQLIFDLRHQFFILKHGLAFLVGRENTTTTTFALPNRIFLLKRLKTYVLVLGKLILFQGHFLTLLVIFIGVVVFALWLLFKKEKAGVISIWFLFPLAILLFFVGNYGFFYDYYLVGTFLPFLFLFVLALVFLTQKKPVLLALFILLFIGLNFKVIKNHLTYNPLGDDNINLATEEKAVGYLCHQPDKVKVLIKVPPVIPYPYLYLIKVNCSQKIEIVQNIEAPKTYLLYEKSGFDNFSTQQLPKILQSLDKRSYVRKYKKIGGVVIEERIIKHND